MVGSARGQQERRRHREKELLATACVFLALRSVGFPRTVEEVARAVGQEASALSKLQFSLIHRLDLSSALMHMQPQSFIARFAVHIRLPYFVNTLALEVCAHVARLELAQGKTAQTVSAGVIFFVLCGVLMVVEQPAKASSEVAAAIVARQGVEVKGGRLANVGSAVGLSTGQEEGDFGATAAGRLKRRLIDESAVDVRKGEGAEEEQEEEEEEEGVYICVLENPLAASNKRPLPASLAVMSARLTGAKAVLTASAYPEHRKAGRAFAAATTGVGADAGRTKSKFNSNNKNHSAKRRKFGENGARAVGGGESDKRLSQMSGVRLSSYARMDECKRAYLREKLSALASVAAVSESSLKLLFLELVQSARLLLPTAALSPPSAGASFLSSTSTSSSLSAHASRPSRPLGPTPSTPGSSVQAAAAAFAASSGNSISQSRAAIPRGLGAAASAEEGLVADDLGGGRAPGVGDKAGQAVRGAQELSPAAGEKGSSQSAAAVDSGCNRSSNGSGGDGAGGAASCRHEQRASAHVKSGSSAASARNVRAVRPGGVLGSGVSDGGKAGSRAGRICSSIWPSANRKRASASMSTSIGWSRAVTGEAAPTVRAKCIRSSVGFTHGLARLRDAASLLLSANGDDMGDASDAAIVAAATVGGGASSPADSSSKNSRAGSDAALASDASVAPRAQHESTTINCSNSSFSISSNSRNASSDSLRGSGSSESVCSSICAGEGGVKVTAIDAVDAGGTAGDHTSLSIAHSISPSAAVSSVTDTTDTADSRTARALRARSLREGVVCGGISVSHRISSSLSTAAVSYTAETETETAAPVSAFALALATSVNRGSVTLTAAVTERVNAGECSSTQLAAGAAAADVGSGVGGSGGDPLVKMHAQPA